MKKTIKKLMAALLAVALLCAMAVPAFAEDASHNSSNTNGKITINNAVNDTAYKIYRILDLQYNETAKSYRYVTNDTWSTFVVGKSDYLTVNPTGNVTWNQSADIKAFAQLAGQYAKDNASTVLPVDKKSGNNSTVEFTGLPLGWYLVVSGLTNDAICSIDTTDTSVVISEKNGKPFIEKYVYRGDPATSKGEYSNDAGIGDTVNFLINVSVLDGTPTGYVIHDAMSKGLSFNEDSVTVKRYRPTAENPLAFDVLTKGTEYTVKKTDTCDASDKIKNCTFEVALDDSVLKPNDVIMVEYTATVTKDAVIGVEGNPNKTILKYGKDYAEESTTKTYVWEMGVHKYTELGADKTHTPLKDAEFKLYKDDGANKKYATFSTATTAEGTSVYKLTSWVDDAANATAVVTPASGNIKLEGLDAGNYYLEETTAPTGYNKLNAPIPVKIESTLPTVAGANATYEVKYGTENTKTGTDNRVPVINQAGVELPSTGGMGTTLFYVIGGGLMVAAVVLLVTKKRMENK